MLLGSEEEQPSALSKEPAPGATAGAREGCVLCKVAPLGTAAGRHHRFWNWCWVPCCALKLWCLRAFSSLCECTSKIGRQGRFQPKHPGRYVQSVGRQNNHCTDNCSSYRSRPGVFAFRQLSESTRAGREAKQSGAPGTSQRQLAWQAHRAQPPRSRLTCPKPPASAQDVSTDVSSR